VRNAAAENAEVDLVNPANGAVYAEVEALGPGTTSPMRLNVGSGSYPFRCLFEDFDPWLDRLQTLIEAARGPNGAWLSVSALDLSRRQQIDAACGQALEVLAPIAVITEPRRT
jgi:iron uptake system component EfeO